MDDPPHPLPPSRQTEAPPPFRPGRGQDAHLASPAGLHHGDSQDEGALMASAWTAREISILVEGYFAGHRLRQIAARLPGRNYRVVQVKAWNLRRSIIPDLPHLSHGRTLSAAELRAFHAGTRAYWAKRRVGRTTKKTTKPRQVKRPLNADQRFAALMNGRSYSHFVDNRPARPVAPLWHMPIIEGHSTQRRVA